MHPICTCCWRPICNCCWRQHAALVSQLAAPQQPAPSKPTHWLALLLPDPPTTLFSSCMYLQHHHLHLVTPMSCALLQHIPCHAALSWPAVSAHKMDATQQDNLSVTDCCMESCHSPLHRANRMLLPACSVLEQPLNVPLVACHPAASQSEQSSRFGLAATSSKTCGGKDLHCMCALCGLLLGCCQ